MKWDYIVVGAGSSGCTLAYELAKSGEKQVLVLEVGGSDRSPYIKVPAGQIRAIARHSWAYQSEPDASRNGKSEPWSRGKVLGGSSSVNGTMYVRGAPSDFDRWAAAGNRGWSFADVAPLFHELETSDRPGASRGKHGPLRVRTVKRPHKLTELFIRSAEQAGFALNEDYNGGSQEGVGFAQLTQHRGLRCSAADAFLKPILRQSNIKLILNALVHRVQIEGTRATGVHFAHQGALCYETAANIIVCGGAINSPQVLMLSGIGEAQELERHGITPRVELPGVGKNLQEHPLLRVIYKTKIQSNNLTGGVWQKLGIAAKFLVSGEGPVSNIFEAGAFLRTRPSEPEPDLQLHFLTVGYETSPQGKTILAHYPSVCVILNKSHPASRGRIRLASSDPLAPPKIECSLLGDRADLETMTRGVELVRKIMAAEPIAGFLECETVPGSAESAGSKLEEWVRNNTGIAFHPAGTCRMGSGPDAVVDSDLRVRGLENMWVADASVLPDLVSGNTNGVCIMIGMKLGRYLNQCRI